MGELEQIYLEPVRTFLEVIAYRCFEIIREAVAGQEQRYRSDLQ